MAIYIGPSILRQAISCVAVLACIPFLTGGVVLGAGPATEPTSPATQVSAATGPSVGLDQEVDEVDRRLAAFDLKIQQAVNNGQRSGQLAADLSKARNDYYHQVAPRLLEIMVLRHGELAELVRQMVRTAEPVKDKRSQIDHLWLLCRPQLREMLAAHQAELEALLTQTPPAIEAIRTKQSQIDHMLLVCRLPWTNSLGMHFEPILPGSFTIGRRIDAKSSDPSERLRDFPDHFTMGSPVAEWGRYEDEIQHEVTLTKSFYMGTTAVTQGQWNAVMHSSIDAQRLKVDVKAQRPVNGSGYNYPMYFVSWNEANEFCRKLSEMEGRSYRLPTEAQWEYACRAGTTGLYGGKEDLTEVGWSNINADFKSHPVGMKKPNAWGLYDVHGNVCQWCSDWYGPYPKGEVTDPVGPETGQYRILRGGSWDVGPRDCRSAYRYRHLPDERYIVTGFRVLLDLPD